LLTNGNQHAIVGGGWQVSVILEDKIMEFSILITSVQQIDAGYASGFNWCYHVTNNDFTDWDGYVKLGSFIRGAFRFSIFALDTIEPLPKKDEMKKLAACCFDYINNPFAESDK
jgi:hypothetical protein